MFTHRQTHPEQEEFDHEPDICDGCDPLRIKAEAQCMAKFSKWRDPKQELKIILVDMQIYAVLDLQIYA
jgi:hypothetical protein